MNPLIEKFGKFIYDETQKKPEKARKLLAAVYSLAGKQARYFPSKALLPSRQYMAAVSADSVVSSLRHPERAAIVSLFLPCEILHAMGIETMFPEGLSCYLAAAGSEKVFIDTAEAAGVPESLCSYHKVLIGLVESGVLPKPRFVLNTTLACDANQLSFRRAAEHFGVPHIVIDIPARCDEAAVSYVARQFRDAVAEIEKIMGMKLDEEKLKETVACSRRTIENYKTYLELRGTRSLSDEMTSEMLSLFALHVLLGTKEAETYTQRLARDVEKIPEGGRGKRLLWVHALPYWQDAMRDILNFNSRCEIVACDMAFDSLIKMDAQRPYESMAKRVLECSFNGGAQRRIQLAADYAKRLKADGIIYFCHWGCKQTLGAAQLAKQAFEELGLPTLVLDGDGCDRGNVSDGQMVTRVQAFLEQLEGMI